MAFTELRLKREGASVAVKRNIASYILHYSLLNYLCTLESHSARVPVFLLNA